MGASPTHPRRGRNAARREQRHMTRGGSTSPAPRGGPSLGSGTDQGAVLRLHYSVVYHGDPRGLTLRSPRQFLTARRSKPPAEFAEKPAESAEKGLLSTWLPRLN